MARRVPALHPARSAQGRRRPPRRRRHQTPGRSGRSTVHPDIADPAFYELCRRCGPFTMTTIERVYALYEAVTHIERLGLNGDGRRMRRLAGRQLRCSPALALLRLPARPERTMWLYDTFEGMKRADRTRRSRPAAGEGERGGGDSTREQRDHPVLAYAGLSARSRPRRSTWGPGVTRRAQGPLGPRARSRTRSQRSDARADRAAAARQRLVRVHAP